MSMVPTKTKKKKPSKGKSKPKDDLAAYRAALSDPFSPAALGARVPDVYAVPTVTRHITKTFTLQSNASGNGSVTICPSAYWNGVSFDGAIVGGGSMVTGDGTSFTNATLITAPNNLFPSMTNYRVVGYGVRVYGTQALTSAQGRVTIAKSIPCTYADAKANTVGGQAASGTNTLEGPNYAIAGLGLPFNSGQLDYTALAALPVSAELSLVNVTENPLIVTPKVSSPEAFNFRSSQDTGVGFDTQMQGAGFSTINTGDASYLRIAGFEAVTIALTGASASTQILGVDVIYHLEGSPNASAQGSVIGDAPIQVANPMGWQKVMAEVALLPSIRAVSEAALNSVAPGLGTMAFKFFN